MRLRLRLRSRSAYVVLLIGKVVIADGIFDKKNVNMSWHVKFAKRDGTLTGYGLKTLDIVVPKLKICKLFSFLLK